MKTKKAPSKRIFNTTHGAFISPIGLPSEVYNVFIEFPVIQTPYILDGHELSKAGSLRSGPIKKPPYIGVEGGGGEFEIPCQQI